MAYHTTAWTAGVQHLDTSSYQVSDLEDIEFNWENSQLDLDAVFRPGVDTPFSPTTFDDLLMGDGPVENPIVLDEEEDKETTPPPTTPRVCQTHRTSQAAEKSSFRSKNRKCTRLFF